jgi:hypothetical protein
MRAKARLQVGAAQQVWIRLGARDRVVPEGLSTIGEASSVLRIDNATWVRDGYTMVRRVDGSNPLEGFGF